MENEAPVLSAIARKAKAHWQYAPEVLEAWCSELEITPQTVRDQPTYVALFKSEIVGFYSLQPSTMEWELAHLWVSPAYMRRGAGGALLSHALATARRGGTLEITVDSDPNAESFYVHKGAVVRGAVPAPIPGQPKRVRPQLAFSARATQQCAPADVKTAVQFRRG